MTVDRRTLLKTTAAGAAFGGPFAGLVTMPAGSHRPPDRRALVPVPDQRDCTCRGASSTGRSTTPRPR
jgi:hypothetical protein